MNRCVWLAWSGGMVLGVIAGGAMPEKPHTGSAELERLKSLAGTWKGTTEMEGKVTEVVVEYHVSSAGSTVVETLYPGTPMEMVSIYHDRNGQLGMTHYCMLGNQPRMTLVAAAPESIELALGEGNDFDPGAESHMHGLKLTFVDETTLQHAWSMYEQGAESGVHTFTFRKIAE